jgi:hypothetical protein
MLHHTCIKIDISISSYGSSSVVIIQYTECLVIFWWLYMVTPALLAS